MAMRMRAFSSLLLTLSNTFNFWIIETELLGPVVESIVSLMSLLRAQLVKCFMTLKPNTLKFFVEKVREAFAHEMLTNKVISFEQPGPDKLWF